MSKKILPDKCAVARDLMPLCVDGTASDASQRKVGKHVTDCPPCAKVYQEMQTQIELDVPDQQETQQFETAVKKVKHKHAWRKLRNVLLGIVLALMVCAGAAYGYYWYFVEEVPLPVDLYEMEMALRSPQNEETPVIIKIKNMPRLAKVHVEVRYDGSVLDENNLLKPNWTMYVWATTTRSVDLESCGYTDNNYYAFDQHLEGENNYDEGDFVINGALYKIGAVYKGAAAAEQTLLFKRDMHGYGMKWTAVNEVLRSVASLEVVGDEKVPVPFVTVSPAPVMTYVPQQNDTAVVYDGEFEMAKSTPTPMPTATPRHTLRP